MSVLETSGITVRFGGNQALSDVSLTVEPGQVVGLIGPNGAGKTTLFNAVCGVTPPTSGTVRIMGRDVSNLPTHKRARLGLGRTFQRLEVFASLSVSDNVRAGLEIRRSWSRGRGAGPQYLNGGGKELPPDAEVALILDRLGLAGLAEVPVGSLPTGQARLVELGRALAARPSVLLLDEPASGLDDAETEAFGALLLQLADAGLGILLVEHDVGLVMQVCSHIYVLDFGQVIASGDPATVRANEAVVAAYLGAG
jgi:branched-chain amino acid transport system ATP-binding protein